MKTTTNVATSHELILESREQFEVTTKTARPTTIRVVRVIVDQRKEGVEWHLRATGPRILKSGKDGAIEKLDTWTYENAFAGGVMARLFAEMSPTVQEELTRLGVTF